MDLYTRCPHCQTVFRLSTAQLEAAGGRVRCGGCLRVFPARQYLVRPKSAPPANPAVAATVATTAAAPATAKPPVATPEPIASRPPAPAPAPAPATIKPPVAAKAPGPELDFDDFFAKSNNQPAATEQLASRTETPAPPSPSASYQPMAPDFGLLAAALTDLNFAHSQSPESPAVSAPPPTATKLSEPTATTVEPVATAPRAATASSPTPDSAARAPAKPGFAPDRLEPEVTKPDVLESDLLESDVLESDLLESDALEPDLSEPDFLEPDLLESDLREPDLLESGLAESTPTAHAPTAPDEDWLSAVTAPAKSGPSSIRDDDAMQLPKDALPATENRRAGATDQPQIDPLAAAAPGRPAAPDLATKASNDTASPALPRAELDETELELELPDDWASLKPAARRNEPVFDDNNGLELDSMAAPAKSAERIPAPATNPSALTDRRVTAPAPAKPQVKPEQTRAADFDLHLEAVDAASAQPTEFGDWHMNQSNTVTFAGAGDELRPQAVDAAPSQPTSKPATTSRAPAAASASKTAPADDRRSTNTLETVHADFGDVSSDWDKPNIALKPPVAATHREPEPEPFDNDSFTADPSDRVYALSDDDSSSWTLASTEPHEDYEAAMQPPAKRRFPWRGLLLTALALLLLSVLVSQLLWPQRAALREDPQWGPWLETVCAQIECNLPPRADISKIALQQRSVLKDRDDARKLQIDLLIANKAAFAQPYPDINLRFTNIEGELVAERRFKPAEYLREAPDSDQMPVNVPVHIAFSVRAPEGNITGYEFNFLPAER